ncbi:MAG: DUF6776 family protein [Burkholderiaceae bacterium]
MKFRLWRRRMSVSVPRMSVRNSTPWPLRWLLGALVLGFSGALALWAFEFGKEIAGLDRNAKEELEALRVEANNLRQALTQAQSVANTSESLLTAEKAAQEQLALQIRQLQLDNLSLRSDLGFFERLIPGSGNGNLNIRGLQVERLNPVQIKWQVLLIQASKNAPDFKGQLEITFSGTSAGQPWTQKQAPQPQAVLIKGYLRQEGFLDIPPQTVVKTVTAKIYQGREVKALYTIKL